MSDLIERLRDHGEHAVSYSFHKSRELSRNAADEIERLTAELEHMTGCRDTQHSIACNLDEETKRLQARVEVLKAALWEIRIEPGDARGCRYIAGQALAATEKETE